MSALLSSTLAEAARRFGERPALVAGNCTLSFAQLDTIGHEVGAWLQALDLRRDSNIEPDAPPVVATTLPPCPEHHAVMVGAARAGWVAAGVNRRLAAEQRAAALAALDPDVVVTTAELDLPGRWHSVHVELADDPGDVAAACRARGATCPPPPDDPAREAVVVMTSGTTGVPKGAVFTDRQLDVIRRTDVGEQWGGAGANLMATELVHIGAMTKLTGALQSGTTTHLLRHWTPAAALELVERERMAVVGGISAQVALMVRDPSIGERDFSAVRLVVAGGGPSDAALIREATKVFGAPYAVRYSATESGGLGCAIDFDGTEPDEVLATVGPPRPGFTVVVGDRPGEPAPPGQPGRVWLRSPAMMERWWGSEEATAATIRGPWLAMGDHGVLDDEGRLRLVGRVDDGWVRGGYNVHPGPVEHALRAHPDVADVAVVARPDPVMGQVGVAVVVPASGDARPARAIGATRDDRHGREDPDTHGGAFEDVLLEHARQRLPKHEVPVAVVTVDELPLTPLHKVDRRALRELVAR